MAAAYAAGLPAAQQMTARRLLAARAGQAGQAAQAAR